MFNDPDRLISSTKRVGKNVNMTAKEQGKESSGLPPITSMDVGKFLRVDSKGIAVWESIPSAESEEY